MMGDFFLFGLLLVCWRHSNCGPWKMIDSAWWEISMKERCYRRGYFALASLIYFIFSPFVIVYRDRVPQWNVSLSLRMISKCCARTKFVVEQNDILFILCRRYSWAPSSALIQLNPQLSVFWETNHIIFPSSGVAFKAGYIKNTNSFSHVIPGPLKWGFTVNMELSCGIYDFFESSRSGGNYPCGVSLTEEKTNHGLSWLFSNLVILDIRYGFPPPHIIIYK